MVACPNCGVFGGSQDTATAEALFNLECASILRRLSIVQSRVSLYPQEGKDGYPEVRSLFLTLRWLLQRILNPDFPLYMSYSLNSLKEVL